MKQQGNKEANSKPKKQAKLKKLSMELMTKLKGGGKTDPGSWT